MQLTLPEVRAAAANETRPRAVQMSGCVSFSSRWRIMAVSSADSPSPQVSRTAGQSRCLNVESALLLLRCHNAPASRTCRKYPRVVLAGLVLSSEQVRPCTSICQAPTRQTIYERARRGSSECLIPTGGRSCSTSAARDQRWAACADDSPRRRVRGQRGQGQGQRSRSGQQPCTRRWRGNEPGRWRRCADAICPANGAGTHSLGSSCDRPCRQYDAASTRASTPFSTR